MRNRAILRSLSLRNKILLISAMLIVIPGAVLGWLAERDGRASLQRVIGRELAREAEHVADRMANAMRVQRETLESVARQDVMREIRVLDLDKRIAQALLTLPAGPETGYVVVDRAGAVVAATDPEWWRSPPVWAVPSRADATTTGVVAGDGVGTGLLFATPIPDPDRFEERLGTLIGFVDWSVLTSISDAVRLELAGQGIAAEIAILDSHENLLRRSVSDEESPASPEILGEVASRAPAASGYSVETDARLIVGHARFDAGAEEWTLLVVEALDEALAPAIVLRNRLFGTIGVALIAALAFAAWGAGRVLRPLQELTVAIRGLTRGEMSSVDVPVRSEDEVGMLARSFNQMIRELDQTQRHLVEAEKFALVGELAAGVAHQVRTSLGVLGSAAQILGRSAEVKSDALSREMIDMVGAEVQRLSRVVDELLTLDRPRTPDIRPTALSIPIRAALDFVAPQAHEKQVSLSFAMPIRDPVVLCDREAMAQVCINLLSNAIAALGPHQSIEVKVEAERGAFAAFTVRDDGRGIPAELRSRIFDPFVTGRAMGVGLGLTYVKRVVHEHRGTVELVDTDAPGACFRVALPTARGTT